MKISNNFQNALPASVELLNIISTDFFFYLFFFKSINKVWNISRSEQNCVISSFYEKKITWLHISGATSATA